MIIALSGRSGSGKTTVVKKLIEILGEDNICSLHQDSYYMDQNHIPYEERERINYDHPDAIEIELFAKHLLMLSNGEIVDKPIYDFMTHTRKQERERVIPQKVILADGIHVLTDETIRRIVDFKIYIDAESDICFIKRLLRDTKERGRSFESVINQYLETVRPMQEKYVVPVKKYADFIITDDGSYQSSIEQLAEIIKRKCEL